MPAIKASLPMELLKDLEQFLLRIYYSVLLIGRKELCLGLALQYSKIKRYFMVIFMITILMDYAVIKSVSNVSSIVYSTMEK